MLEQLWLLSCREPHKTSSGSDEDSRVEYLVTRRRGSVVVENTVAGRRLSVRDREGREFRDI